MGSAKNANETATQNANVAAQSSETELERIKAELEEAKAKNKELCAIVEQQSAVIKNNIETFDKLKESTFADTNVGKSVMEINERMKEKVTVLYPLNPFDPDKTHVPVYNPITGQVDKVKVGEYVEVNRAVKEILDNSAKADKLTLVLQQKEASDFEQKTLDMGKR